MKPKKNKKVYTKEFRDRMNEVTKFCLDFQSDSFSSIDTKSQTYISIVAIFIAILLGILTLGIDKLDPNEIFVFKIITSFGIILFLLNTLLFFNSIAIKDFKTGVSPQGLNNMKDSSIEEFDIEIFSNLYWSVEDNREVLGKKAKWLKISEWFLTVNFVFTVIICIYFISII